MIKPYDKSCSNCESVESEFPCLMTNCSVHHDRDNAIKWRHANCGGYFRIYENGKEKCQKCDTEDYFCNWNYSCSADNKDQKIDDFRLRAILQMLMGLSDKGVSEDFFWNLKASLRHQRELFPEKFN